MRRIYTLLIVFVVSMLTNQLHAQIPATSPTSGQVRIFIPFALHVPVRNADGSIAKAVDGYGHVVNGNEEPQFDTLIGIANPSPYSINVRFMFFDNQGVPQLWGDGRPYRDYLLHSNCSVATTLIPNNIFPDPPQSFIGYGILELTNASGPDEVPALPAYVLLGGGGFYPNHWNTFSVSLPVYRSSVPERSHWVFPYLIPYFEDPNHYGDSSYRTGMVLTNFSQRTVRLKLTYHVGDIYPKAGYTVNLEKTLEAGHVATFDLYEEMRKAGYPEGMASEGWLSIDADQPSALVPYLIHANRAYNRFGVGQAPTILDER